MEWPKLSTDQKQSILDAIRTLEDLSRVWDALQECGEDCSLRRSEALETRRKLESLMSRFAS